MAKTDRTTAAGNDGAARRKEPEAGGAARDDALRERLVDLLGGGHASRPPAELMREFPYDRAGVVPEELPYSAWSLVEHLRRAQDDILEFSRDPNYESPSWPEGYWPESREPESEEAWSRAIARFEEGLEEMVRMVRDPDRDLLSPFPHGEGQTLFREAVMLSQHNAYHTGQLVVIGRQLGVW